MIRVNWDLNIPPCTDRYLTVSTMERFHGRNRNTGRSRQRRYFSVSDHDETRDQAKLKINAQEEESERHGILLARGKEANIERVRSGDLDDVANALRKGAMIKLTRRRMSTSVDDKIKKEGNDFDYELVSLSEGESSKRLDRSWTHSATIVKKTETKLSSFGSGIERDQYTLLWVIVGLMKTPERALSQKYSARKYGCSFGKSAEKGK